MVIFTTYRETNPLTQQNSVWITISPSSTEESINSANGESYLLRIDSQNKIEVKGILSAGDGVIPPASSANSKGPANWISNRELHPYLTPLG